MLMGIATRLTSDPTIKGVTDQGTLNMVCLGEFNDPKMGHRIAYCGEGKMKRKDFGMSFSMMVDGKFVVGDEVQILLEGEVIEKQPEASAHA
jgi:polyisoprenoid-binding protein YceI